MSFQSELLRSHNLKAGFFLLILALVGLGALTPWLGLVGDDWWFFSHLEAGAFLEALSHVTPARLGVAYLWTALWHVFGLHLWPYYVLNVLLHWSSAFLIFIMLKNVFRLNVEIATVAAALVLLYPADTTHVYLSTIALRIATLLASAGALIWLRSLTRPIGSRLQLLLSLILMLVALLTYETFFFLFALLPLALMFAQPHPKRNWLTQWVPIYSMLVGYLVFRLWIAYAIGQSRGAYAYYMELRLEPGWIRAQVQGAISATTWKGWLYALKVILDWSQAGSFALLFLAVLLAIVALVFLERAGVGRRVSGSQGLALLGAGALLSAAAVTPVVVSNFALSNAVGTLYGRLLHNSAIGHGLMVIGLVILVSRVARSEQTQTVIRNTLFGLLVAVALVGSLGVQALYARAWSTQLDIVEALQDRAPSVKDEAVLTLLRVPSGAFDIRFYYPFTRLVRSLYANPTLHVLPYQRDFPPDEQTVVFGERRAYALVELFRGEIDEFDYEMMMAFEIHPSGGLTPVSEIGEEYLCEVPCADLPFVPRDGWLSAQQPVPVSDVGQFRLERPPPDTAWRRLLLQAAEFRARFPLPRVEEESW